MAWARLQQDLPTAALDRVTTVEPLERAVELGEAILKGQMRGRVVIDVNA